MEMRKVILVPILILMVAAAGCLFKPPAEVKFSVDKTVVSPGDTIHLIVFVNNTGKVGLTGATLILKSEDFRILQEPQFPQVLPVGDSVQLVWILQAPLKPGIYDLKVSLELNDELKRIWTGFYGQFRIKVSIEAPAVSPLEVEITSPNVTTGGSVTKLEVSIRNTAELDVSIDDVSITLLPGMEVVNHTAIPVKLGAGKATSVYYWVRVPYAYREGYISTLVEYAVGDSKRSLVKSAFIKVIWRPWTESEATLREAYKNNYQWLYGRFLVDEYWVEKYNSTPLFDSAGLREVALPVVNSSESEVEAAWKLYEWVKANYRIGGNTTTLNTMEMLNKSTLSVTEAQLLLTGLLKSVSIPARVVSLYNGTDCTINPMTEFYTADGWYVVDFRQGIVGSVDEFVASRRFPKVYQLVTEDGYRIVAHSPQDMVGHEHVDVTPYFLIDLQERMLRVVSQKVKPELRSKLNLIMEGLDENEALYAMFLFSAAPDDELNNVLEKYSVKEIQETIKPIYDFYWGVPWSWDFSKYWVIFREGLP